MILTEEQKQADREERTKKFQEGFLKLQNDTQMSVKPQITPDGPVISLIDVKKYEDNSTK